MATAPGHCAAEKKTYLEASDAACHGRCYGFEQDRDQWDRPRVIVTCDADARPGYDSMNASEYMDSQSTLRGKVKAFAVLVRMAKCCVVYSGAGLSTGAGISDYASQSPDSVSGGAVSSRNALFNAIRAGGGGAPGNTSALRSPLCAQPTLAHRVFVSMSNAGFIHRWINQNHDGLPQKAGLPQERINDIHGAWHAPDNPVVAMSGSLRDDLYKDLLHCEQSADLTIAIGTSLCGMNADRVVTTPAARRERGESTLGSVIIGLQQTPQDEKATLRIFGRCDDVMELLAEELGIQTPPAWPAGEFFTPPILAGRSEEDYVFESLRYNSAGARFLPEESGTRACAPTGKCPNRQVSRQASLDLRDDKELVIPTGMHAGATGVVDGLDREGNVRCRFTLRPKTGKLRAPMAMLLGRWWIQAAVDGTVKSLPVVNKPTDEDSSEAARRLRELMEAYAKPAC